MEGDSPYLRQRLLKWVLRLERVQEHFNLLLSLDAVAGKGLILR